MRTTIVSLVMVCCVLPVASYAQRPLPEITEDVIDQVLSPMVEAALESPRTKIALREEVGTVKGHNLGDVVAGAFFDAGLEVFVLEGKDTPADDALLLTWTVQEVGVAYPRTRRGFLGIRGQKTSRSVRLGISAELTDPSTGQWVWRGAPRARYEDWVQAPDPVLPEHPLFGPTPSRVLPTGAGGSESLWERGFVAGLLGGVILLYFSGVGS